MDEIETTEFISLDNYEQIRNLEDSNPPKMDWQPLISNYSYRDYKKQANPEKAKKSGRTLAIVACLLVFSLVFAVVALSASALFSDAILNGQFSLSIGKQEESGAAPSKELNSVADIVEDVSKSTCLVLPLVYNSNSDESYGTGLIVGEQGNVLYILTCYHLISGTNEISVCFADSSLNISAYLRGYDIETDLAVLYVYKDQIPETILKNLKLASFGDSESITAGELAIVIGNPSGVEYQGSVSCGVISAANRSISKLNSTQTTGVTYTLIQTDAAVNPGDSGAPLVNGRGEIIGICNHYVDDVDGEGMGFAIAAHKAIPVIESIISKGYMPRPYLGIVGYSVIDWTYSEYFGLEYGAVVSNLTPGGPAELAGILPYDVIVSFAGTTVNDFDAVKAELAKYNVGDVVEIVVYRFYNMETPEYVTLKFELLDKYATKE